MSRDFRLYLADIVQCCDRVVEYTDGHTLNSCSDDYKFIDAVARNLEIIGEAVKNTPSEILVRRPKVNWSDVAKFRDVIAHQYFRIKLRVVWDTIHNEIGGIRTAASNLFIAFQPDDDK